MNNGERRQTAAIKKSISQIRADLELKASDSQHAVFRIILLAVALFLITGNWLFIDRHENYRIGYPSAKDLLRTDVIKIRRQGGHTRTSPESCVKDHRRDGPGEKIAAEVSAKIESLSRETFHASSKIPCWNSFPDFQADTDEYY
jgi:hypothetical protein